jgi:hypothetical protein
MARPPLELPGIIIPMTSEPRDLRKVACFCIENGGSLQLAATIKGYRCRLIGYSDEQYNAADYSGEPYVTLDFPGDLGHAVSIGPEQLVIGAGWNSNLDVLGLYTLPLDTPVVNGQRFAPNDLTRVRTSIFNPAAPLIDTKLTGFLSKDRRHWLVASNRGFSYFDYDSLNSGGFVTSEKLLPEGSGADAGNIWDVDYDADHNLWWGNDLGAGDGQGGVRMVSRARYEAGEATLFNFQKVFNGSNFLHVNGIAIDSLGGLHVSQWAPVRVAYYAPAIVGAAGPVASNPAPTRSLIYPGPLDDSSSICLTKQGGMVHTDWTNGLIRRFTPEQVAAGGMQTPVGVIHTPPNFRPWIVRLRHDLAFHER